MHKPGLHVMHVYFVVQTMQVIHYVNTANAVPAIKYICCNLTNYFKVVYMSRVIFPNFSSVFLTVCY